MAQPVALVILDGFGLADTTAGNAVAAARTPVLDSLFAAYPHTALEASGRSVGLPEGQMGNSEVGHTNIGAGRIVYQELTRITKAIEEGAFFENPVLLEAFDRCRGDTHALHLMGLLSDGGVHSHNSHLYALLELAKRRGVRRVYVHALMDGRDCAPTSGLGYLEELQAAMARIGIGELATVVGRYYAMDRDNRWDRVATAYHAMTLGEGETVEAFSAAVSACYDRDVTDEFLPPLLMQGGAGRVEAGDSVVCFNFRPDRAREITRAFCEEAFDGFARKTPFLGLHYVCMTQYDAQMPGVAVAFAPQRLTATLGEVVAQAGLRQLHIAETEKYAHVTFFFAGGREEPFAGEERVLVPSPQVATYDLQPEMSAPEVTDRVIAAIEEGGYDLIVLNYANCDMVGHTGSFDAAVRAVEAVDAQLGRMLAALHRAGGVALITADHGNAEEMEDACGNVRTAHTTNPVPLIVTQKGLRLAQGGILADLAPTVLKLMQLPQPAEMTGHSLL